MVQVIEATLADLDVKVRYIRDFIRQGCADANLRQLVRSIVAAAGPYRVSRADPWSVVTVLYEWVQRTIPFERDPATGEVLDLRGVVVAGPLDLIQSPAATLQRGRGDCVALTVLLGSLICAAGIPVKVGLQDTQGQGIDHVLLMVGLPSHAPQHWFPLDLTADAPGELRPGFGQVLMVTL